MSEQELELLQMCLSVKGSKQQLFDLTTINPESRLASAMKIVLQKDQLPFPLISVAASEKATISGLHVFHLLFSQIKTHVLTGVADIPLDELYLTQSYYQRQALLEAQRKTLATKFKPASESSDSIQSRVIQQYLQILEKSVSLLESLRELGDESS